MTFHEVYFVSLIEWTRETQGKRDKLLWWAIQMERGSENRRDWNDNKKEE